MTDIVERLRNTTPEWAYESERNIVYAKCTDLKEAADEIERLRDKCGGLGEDLISAVGVAYNHGAVDWVKANYPDFPAFDYERSE